MAKFKPGQSGNPIGKPKGTRNKISKNIKQVFLSVFEEMSGQQALLEWAQENRDAFFSMIAKLLPKDIEIKSENEQTINIISSIPEPRPLSPEYAKPPRKLKNTVDLLKPAD